MRYLSVCSGIEAATVAWHQLGWTPVAFSEIEPFPCAVLAERYPHIPNLGDMTRYADWPTFAIDVLVGGTPCQSFSVAGLRAGLADPRGNRALVFLGLVDKYRPRWVIWENVPGVRSSWSGPTPPSDLEQGREWESEETSDFGCFLDGLAKLGYCCAYRSLDAQYLGVAQRRERVFVVAHLGDWRPPAAVLLERHGLLGHPAPRREAWQATPPSTTSRADRRIAGANGARTGLSVGAQDAASGHLLPWPAELASTLNAHFGEKQGLEDQHINGGGRSLFRSQEVAKALTARMQRLDSETETFVVGGSFDEVAHSLRGEGFDASEDGTGRGTPLVTLPINTQIATRSEALDRGTGFGIGDDGDPAFTLVQAQHSHAVAFEPGSVARNAGPSGESDTVSTLRANMGDNQPAVRVDMQVRRLTPRECERLQGFPDDYTLVTVRKKPAADGPRYKALGNSMAVPVMHWIGSRIEQVEALLLDVRATEFPAMWLRMLS